MWSGATICASEMLARSGKIGWFSSIGPKRARSCAPTSSTQKMACGLPMLSAEGECSTGASIGPIWSSIRRVSWNGSRKRNLVPAQARPAHIDGKARRADARHREKTGAGLEEQAVLVGRARHDRIAHHRPGDAARAVAAGGGLRAVGVVDAQVGVGAGRDRIVERHQLVEARPRLGRDRPRFRGGKRASRSRAGRRSRSRCRDRSSSGSGGSQARSRQGPTLS